MPKAALSTTRASQAGARRPLVAASYLGCRQATASTVNETTSAATAPAIASSGGIGRSAGPPSPWASVNQSLIGVRLS